MKVILLAAGKSTRLKKITENIPKPMLRVGNEIVLEHNIFWLKKYGIYDIYINLHYLPKVIKDYFGNGKKLGIKIKYSYEKEILGTAGGIKKIIDRYKKDNWKSDFLVVYGDSFYPIDYDLKKIIAFHKKKKGIATIGFYHKKSEIWKSGIAVLDENKRINNFIEKPNPKEIKSDLVNTGIYIFSSGIINYLPKSFSDFGKDIFPTLLKKNIPIYGYVFRQDLIPIDTPELYLRAQKL
ncbi:MAG: NDP-sugar synthase [Candidatus Paceibacterota bacterium]|jgi:mannose-1-phosphate guanylyltransferase/phosphomannomutase